MRAAFLGAPFVAAAIAGALHFADADAVLRFVSAGLALSGLAYVVGVSTESVGARFGPATTGVLQSTLGNLPELFIVLFALAAGEVVVATTAVLGSLFANALLVLGLMKQGAEKAAGVANPTLDRMYERMGFVRL